MRKIRVLVVSESSFVDTGFGVYAHELLSRLHATNELELLELGCQGAPDDPRIKTIPWAYVSNEPPTSSQADSLAYQSACSSSHSPKVGAFSFERACLHFRPDVVLTYRDWHDDEWVQRSPFRQRFAWAAMATVDSEPQSPACLSTYLSCDAVLTYTQWGADVLGKQTAGRISASVASPAADTNLFRLRPEENRLAVLKSLGLGDSPIVIGACLRNQPRKLIPDLFTMFALHMSKQDTAARSWLWLHTTYPDCGWDLPALIRDCGFGSKVLLSYLCRECKQCFPSAYRGSRVGCRFCGQDTAFLPQPANGVSRSQLAGVMSLFDFFIQSSSCEGFGLPMVEAAACGVPVLAVDYSAMSEVVRKVGGIPIPVERHFQDPGTGTIRALPNCTACSQDLSELVDESASQKKTRRESAALAARQQFSYDDAAAAWMKAVRENANKGDWDGPPKLAPRFMPTSASDADLAVALYRDFLGRPDLAVSYQALKLARDMGWGRRGPADATEMGASSLFGREEATEEFVKMADSYDDWERARAAK